MAFMGHVTCLPGLGKQPRPSPQAGGWSRHVGVFIPPWRLLGCCWPDDSLKPRWWPWPRAHSGFLRGQDRVMVSLLPPQSDVTLQGSTRLEGEPPGDLMQAPGLPGSPAPQSKHAGFSCSSFVPDGPPERAPSLPPHSPSIASPGPEQVHCAAGPGPSPFRLSPADKYPSFSFEEGPASSPGRFLKGGHVPFHPYKRHFQEDIFPEAQTALALDGHTFKTPGVLEAFEEMPVDVGEAEAFLPGFSAEVWCNGLPYSSQEHSPQVLGSEIKVKPPALEPGPGMYCFQPPLQHMYCPSQPPFHQYSPGGGSYPVPYLGSPHYPYQRIAPQASTDGHQPLFPKPIYSYRRRPMDGRILSAITSLSTNALRRWRTNREVPLVRAACGPSTQPRSTRCRRSCRSGRGKTPSLCARAWPSRKSWTASLETRGRSWAPRSWAAHPLGWQAQAPSSPWHLRLGSPSRCTQSTRFQAPCLAKTPCRTSLGATRPPATGRHTHTSPRAWALLDRRRHCSRSQMGTLSCGPSRAPPRTHLCPPTPHPATAPSCWRSPPRPGPCMTRCCLTEISARTWMPSIPLSPTLTSKETCGNS
ncbi:forkhead box protein N1 isoform X6 [Pipistrellus kuhlii]|uniref:forkhead box protein N1 isoform X6 n=1 Tax=Pipistrellus kuhlii TaxID=59472 RepID=UPI001E2740EE|nr:forkhead box protein N1 isoform X6 [Pipistrellus kuhlii]